MTESLTRTVIDYNTYTILKIILVMTGAQRVEIITACEKQCCCITCDWE